MGYVIVSEVKQILCNNHIDCWDLIITYLMNSVYDIGDIVRKTSSDTIQYIPRNTLCCPVMSSKVKVYIVYDIIMISMKYL